MSVYPIDLSPKRTRWCAYKAEDAKAFATALTVAGISFICRYGRAGGIEQWCFDRLPKEPKV